MSVRERPNAKYGDLQVKERVTQLLYCGIQSRLTVFERLALVLFLFLALDTFGVAGLNADGIALLEFKKSITSDAQSALQNWNYVDDTPCYWNGITCMKVQGVDRVVQIVLPRKSLGGTLSPYLGNLTYLAVVNLDTNNFTGQIPGELFKSPALSSLYLSDNNFSGAIPTAICALGDQLRVIELNGNRLAGGFPDDFLNCYGLRRLVLSYNNFKGPIPLGIGSKLTQLKRLDLSVNHFNGSIPEDFGNLTNLLPQFPLNLSNNRFSGAIPPSLANLGRVLIDLSNNNLSGPVPPDSYFQAQGPTSYIGNANLCGSPLKVDCASSPSPSLSPFDNIAGTSATGSFSKRPLSKAAIIGIGVGCAIVGLLMASILFYFILRKLHIRKKSLGLNSPARSDNANSLRGCLCSWRESGGGSMSADEDDENDLMHLSGVLSFSLEELLRASAYVLGKSGVGIIYKAVLDDGTMVAVRRLGEGGEQRQKEFESEVKTIAQVRHLNIVTLHSYSWRAEEKLLIYDYVSNGNLETALHSRSNASKGPLTWEMRLQIAIGAAQGLAHIHECSARKYVHGDIKPSNILLDDCLVARIADFGLQRLLSLAEPESVREHGSSRGDNDRASSVTPAPVVVPELGRKRSLTPRGAHMVVPFLMGVYQAPEAISAKKPTQKSDVYSFGIVLLELLTGTSPFNLLAAGQVDLASRVRVALQEKRPFSEIYDPSLLNSSNEQTKMIETLQVALACTSANPDTRPKMKQVAESLEQL